MDIYMIFLLIMILLILAILLNITIKQVLTVLLSFSGLLARAVI